ncbi:carbohydrate ABC transporter permease [Propioniciclava coleopterorum]|uniref:Carbohydrate ABC transporter permease n=1 Tax=Propioniciclava coleopterorum TaxID=2714937 RepID=A0A6G7Y6J6_9ACTN|nr:carbohydrate ABC transporter permease [Propioniciclava coleopterorum]QIK72435.1 carbohydrate ABC transporter permease [Propioniciclava coleopterorum]
MSETRTVAAAAESPTGRRPRRQPIVVHVVLIIGAIAMTFPFIWQVLSSLKNFAGATAVPPQWVPDPWVFTNFGKVLTSMPFLDMAINSLVITVVTTAGHVVLCTMAGYAFARMHFVGRGALFILVLSVLMVPGQLFLLPQYEIIQAIGWLDSVPGIILPGLFSAFGTFLMRQFFMSLPAELEEAARLDGANQFQIFFKVMLPLAKSGVIALTVFSVLGAWNAMLWPLIVTSTQERMPLSVGLSQMLGLNFTDYPTLMAGSLMATIPMIVVFLFLQKQFIAGIAFSGSKG